MNDEKLENKIATLEEKIARLEKEIRDLEFLTPKPVLTPALIGQIGGFVMGAIVLIGIFWF